MAEQHEGENLAQTVARQNLQAALDAYPFEGLPNTRDLGGITNAEGRCVKQGKLYRSGALDRAQGNDLQLLFGQCNVRTVIDLRRTCAPESDNSLLLASYPVECITAGIDGMRALTPQRLRGTSLGFTMQLVSLYARPKGHLRRMYPAMLLDQENRQAFAAALDALCQEREGAILWHCTIGKDRTGLLTMLLLYCLDVPWELIAEDYLASEPYMDRFGEEDDRILRTYGFPEALRASVHEGHLPRAEYLEAAVKAVERRYGTFDAYLEQALGITPEKKQQLKNLYLD